MTNSLGSITIVELAQTLAGTRFTATVDAAPLAINPMDAPFQRSAALNSVAKLKGAVITNQDGSTRPFVPKGTSDDALGAVAQSNQDLGKAYAKLAAPARPQAAQAASRAAMAAPLPHVADGILDDNDVGDLFSWLKSGIESVVSIIEDAANDVWHFVVSIAGKVYYGILDAVEKVVAAAVWIYNAIKIIIQDIILFLEFLFLWQDILVTHSVMKNIKRRTR